MKIRFGTIGAPIKSPKSGTPAAIAYIRELALDALEIAWVRSVRVKDESCLLIKGAAQEHDVKLSIHAPYYINLNSQTAELMAKSDERLILAARKGYLAGAGDIIFHPGSYHDQPPEQVYERIKQKLQEIQEILRSEGITVTLRPETMGKQAMFGTLEEVVQLAKDVKDVAPCIDVAHLHARTGDGSFNSYDEFAAMLKLVQKELGKPGLHNLHFHCSGIEYGPKGERNHLPLEESDLQWRAFLQACYDFDVRGTIVFESPNIEEDALLA
ncbi:MAG: TIM barrel protein, partial [Anaerolineae bacterium]|nr:TIM barrel protein [Anaerolineae bacterium]